MYERANTYPRFDVDAFASSYERLENSPAPTQREIVPPLPAAQAPHEDSAIARDAQHLANAAADKSLEGIRTVLQAMGTPTRVPAQPRQASTPPLRAEDAARNERDKGQGPQL